MLCASGQATLLVRPPQRGQAPLWWPDPNGLRLGIPCTPFPTTSSTAAQPRKAPMDTTFSHIKAVFCISTVRCSRASTRCPRAPWRRSAPCASAACSLACAPGVTPTRPRPCTSSGASKAWWTCSWAAVAPRSSTACTTSTSELSAAGRDHRAHLQAHGGPSGNARLPPRRRVLRARDQRVR